MPIITRTVYELVFDENGNQVFDNNGVAVTRFVGTEEVEEPEWEDPTLVESVV